MRPGIRWLGESRLQINAYDNPPRELGRAELLFVPVTPNQCWVGWDIPRRYALVYPCSGALTDAGRGPVPTALGALLGAARAAVLVLLASPLSTTQLVALTGQGLGWSAAICGSSGTPAWSAGAVRAAPCSTSVRKRATSWCAARADRHRKRRAHAPVRPPVRTGPYLRGRGYAPVTRALRMCGDGWRACTTRDNRDYGHRSSL
ncbi:hypothetical protein SCALM49S_00236 [Streptomyces californicus]